mmetsp:Transcript_2405/g.6837  ORF Transcript_2405/g.6837 Transcript_2405/m.6837 type:complete len:256 (+) Transcript_2405:110-877(+)
MIFPLPTVKTGDDDRHAFDADRRQQHPAVRVELAVHEPFVIDGAARTVGSHLPRVAQTRAPVRAAAERIFLLRLRLAVGVGLAGRLVLERLVQRIPVREFRRALDALLQHVAPDALATERAARELEPARTGILVLVLDAITTVGRREAAAHALALQVVQSHFFSFVAPIPDGLRVLGQPRQPKARRPVRPPIGVAVSLTIHGFFGHLDPITIRAQLATFLLRTSSPFAAVHPPTRDTILSIQLVPAVGQEKTRDY